MASPYEAYLHGQALGQEDIKNRDAGLKATLERQELEGKIKADEQSYLLNAQLNPHKVTAAGLDNLQKEEGIVGKRLENKKAGFDELVRNTLGTNHFVEKAKLEQHEAQYNKTMRMADSFSGLADEMSNTAPVLRASVLRSRAAALGLNESQIESLAVLPPSEMPDLLRQLAQRAQSNSPEVIRKRIMADEELGRAKELAKYKSDLDMKLENLKTSNKAMSPSEYKTLEAAYIAYMERVRDMPDGESRNFYIQQGKMYLSALMAVKDAAAQPTVAQRPAPGGGVIYEPIPKAAPSAMIQNMPEETPVEQPTRTPPKAINFMDMK
jgi:hypothetical protein